MSNSAIFFGSCPAAPARSSSFPKPIPPFSPPPSGNATSATADPRHGPAHSFRPPPPPPVPAPAAAAPPRAGPPLGVSRPAVFPRWAPAPGLGGEGGGGADHPPLQKV